MKIIILLLTCIFFCSCSANKASTLKNETEHSISSSVRIGKTTNCQVLQKLKKPTEKIIYSNGKYAYVYTFTESKSSGFDKFMSWWAPTAGKGRIVKTTTKGANFTFDKNILSDFEVSMNKKRLESKYRFVDIPYKPEIENIANLSIKEFLDKIVPGIKKGALFRLVGKPKYSSDHRNEERWVFLQDNNEDKSNDSLLYIIELKDNVVVDRYIGNSQTENINLTDEEKACIAHDI